jgi:hypothetical protein
LLFKRETKAISTLLTIVLILVFMVVGAFISYMWVMGSYYNMPENTSLLVFENIVFPSDNFTYFNVTILNPSNSVMDTNITAFIVNIESRNETQIVTTADPALPFQLKKATRQTFRCITNWSNFAGETVRIEPIAANASTRSYEYTTPKASLLIYGFDATQNVDYFNITVANSPESVMNLNISQILLFDQPFKTIVPQLPVQLTPGGAAQTFRCDFSWQTLLGENATITVRTVEGFEQTFTATTPFQGAFLYIQLPITFDYADTSYFNVTITSLSQSTAIASLESVNLTQADNTTITLPTLPPMNLTVFPVVAPNQSLTVKCLWDWDTHRNETITITVYTKQGFTIDNVTTRTPPAVIWTIDSVGFDLSDLEHFSLNITNAPKSLQQITVTEVKLNQNTTTITSTTILPGNNATIACDFNWSSYVGQTVDITASATYGTNQSSQVYEQKLPFLKMASVSFSNFELGNPYMNVTIFNSQFSPVNTTITYLLVRTDNETFTIDGNLTNPKLSPAGYTLNAGAETTFICPYDWSQSIGKNITVVAQTTSGIEVSLTLRVQ